MNSRTSVKETQKCGEVTLALQLHEKTYALNCIFCGHVCLQLEAFVAHIEREHAAHLCATMQLGAAEEEEEAQQYAIEDTTTDIPKEFPTELQQAECANFEEMKFPSLVKHSEVAEAVDLADPLDEPPLSVLPMELTELHMLDAKMEQELEYTNIAPAANEDGNMDGETKLESEEEHLEDNWETAELTDSSEDCESESDSAEKTPEHAFDVNNKELTLAIIEGYQKQRILWAATEPLAKNRKKREEALRKIANSINKQMGVSIKTGAIRQQIRRLRYKFRSELQNQQQAKKKGEPYTPLWYYDKLAFLNTSIKYKPRGKRGAKALANEKSTLPLPNLTDAQNKQLIEVYKSSPCLWDVQHVGYRFKNQRQEALEQMLTTIKSQLQLDFSQEELQKKIYRIRYACTQEKHRQLECERQQQPYQAVCEYYADIAFLEPFVGPFKCVHCAQIFNGVDQYKIHKSQHDGSLPFTCPICERGFMKVGNCTVHLRRHTRDFPFECKVCGKRYATSTDVNVHMRYHTGDKPYFCEVCGQSFRTWTFFDAHMRRHQKRANHKCTICTKAFYENNKLMEHMKAHLNIRDQVCNVCGKAFTSSKYLRQHKLLHAEKKKYTCKICAKDFAQYSGLSGHMKSHGTTLSGAVTVDDQRTSGGAKN